MKVKILEYKVWRGPKVKVQSHNFKKGKWIKNPKFELHENIINEAGNILWSKNYTKELNKEAKREPTSSDKIKRTKRWKWWKR